ncbi:hypothetical protein SAMN06297387_13033 [Streptomyces zhaozhouensis]|uniref:Uncharacterized protein n=1 Tax=Streptomyces zhaozhouensis TaxID=1300267 RepID=A0A286E8X8_9ACTN|nr:DUF6519 domain-containing protein [Streptomyces zhaozhouensis]SOD67368.1 hypothetical protein SAMN06297387_13033 [Streptomyces zhaozhouensis]
MHADLSRITFQPERHYSAVVAQQGRVQLDADVNEQAAIQLHQARTATVDLVGRHAGPEGAVGFEIHLVGSSGELDTLTIGGGRYYVDGIQVDADRPRAGIPVPDDGAEGSAEGGAQAREEPAEWTYWDQPGAHLDRENPADRLPTGYPYLVYLRVFERLVTAAEDPRLREVALGAATPDTTARVKVVWQVLPLPAGELGLDAEAGPDEARAAFRRWADEEAAHRSALAARAERPARADEDPCLVGPDARFRGLENQLYRVEVHRGGPAGEATFKWSRENGSVTFPVDEVDGSWLRLGSLGADDKLSLDVGDRVELLDTAAADRQAALPLARVEELDLPGRRVRLSAEPPASVGRRPDLHPYLRRWDHSGGGRGRARLHEGALPVEEGRWLPLEDGVEVYFAAGGGYRTGEHWLVPARTATGGVEWPTDAGHRPLLRGPLGVTPHLAPLAWVWGEGSEPDLRDSFGPLATPVPAASAAELAAERAAAEETRAAAEAAGAE